MTATNPVDITVGASTDFSLVLLTLTPTGTTISMSPNHARLVSRLLETVADEIDFRCEDDDEDQDD